MRPAVLGPAALAVLRAERPLLTEADHRDPIRLHALRDEVFQRRFGAVVAEGQIVFVRAAVVAVALDQDEVTRMSPQPLGVRGEHRRLLGTDVVLVEVEVDVPELGDRRELPGLRSRRREVRPGLHGVCAHRRAAGVACAGSTAETPSTGPRAGIAGATGLASAPAGLPASPVRVGSIPVTVAPALAD